MKSIADPAQPLDANKLREAFDTDESINPNKADPFCEMMLPQTGILFLSALASGGEFSRLIGNYAVVSVFFALVKLAWSLRRTKSESPDGDTILLMDRFTSDFIVLNGIVVPALFAIAYCIFQMPLVFSANPLGTMNELAIVLAVPIAIGISWYTIAKKRLAYATISGGTAGLALGVSAALTATWLFQPPLSPNWGPTDALGWFIVWSPIAFVASTLILHVLLNVRNDKFRRVGSLSALVGIAASSALTFAPHIQDYATDLKLNTAMNSTGEDEEQAISYLKSNFSVEKLALLFAEPGHDGRYAFGKLRLFERSTIRPMPYFFITGKSAESLFARGTPLQDAALGQQTVGECVPGLALISSNLVGTLNSDSLSGSLDWTMVFRNAGKNPAETRSEIQLPAGAVVSRVTAWINGKPVEASFDSVGKTTAAYQWVVQNKRDPILVTSLGKDRVFVQAYPVPPYGGNLKLRIGIKTPLTLSSSGKCNVDLPRLSNKNFVSKNNEDVNLTGTQAFVQQAGSPLTSFASDKVHLHGKLAPARKGELLLQVSLEHPRNLNLLATPDPTSHDGKYIVQRIIPQDNQAAKKLVFVIDTSSSLKQHSAAIKNALSSLRSDPRASVIFAGQPTKSTMSSSGGADNDADREELLPEYSVGEALKQIDSVQFLGGTNNDTAVLQGLESAAMTPDSTVIWVHGPQPLPPSFTELESLGISTKPRLVDLQLGSEKNQVIDQWRTNHLNSVVAYDHVGTENLGSDLTGIARRYSLGEQGFVITQQLVDKRPDIPISASPLLAAELSSLWAFKAISGLLEREDNTNAERIGIRYHIVSPVTGAVALEKNSDYAHYELKKSQFKAAQPASGPDVGQIAAGSTRHSAGRIALGSMNDVAISQAPSLDGAVNGTIGPQGSDATIVYGVNTSGATRVNNLANLEALVNIVGNLLQLTGYFCCAIALFRATRAKKISPMRTKKLSLLALGALTLAVTIMPTLNYLIASARDANLFN